jgi:hypothetical protein
LDPDPYCFAIVVLLSVRAGYFLLRLPPPFVFGAML